MHKEKEVSRVSDPVSEEIVEITTGLFLLLNYI